MEEEIKFIIDSIREIMGNVFKYLEKKLINIRVGKVFLFMVFLVMVDYYGIFILLN